MGHLGAKVAVTVVAVVSLLMTTCGGGAASRALDNSSWTLQSIGGDVVRLDVPPILEFGTAGRFDGFAGCNDFFGEAEIFEESINVELGGMTARGCPETAAEAIEEAYTDALPTTTTWALDGDTLTLAGTTDLVFARS